MGMQDAFVEGAEGPHTEREESIRRDPGEIDPVRRAAVVRWCGKINAARKHFEDPFKRMRENMVFARLGASKAWVDEDNYTANIVGRHINTAVAALYAKNPKAKAKRRPKLDYAIWDGKPESLMAAQQGARLGDPNALALAEEITTAQASQQMMDKMGRTLEILFEYYLDEQEPRAKVSFKQLVRRTKVCSVGYVKLDFQRLMEKREDVTAQISDVMNQVQTIERITADAADEVLGDQAPELEDLRVALETLQAQETVLMREGLLLSFPRSTAIIPDPNTRQLKGWVGTRWLAEEMDMTAEQVKEAYSVDLGVSFTAYTEAGALDAATVFGGDGEKTKYARVWKVQDKATGTYFVIADGYPDYLKEPAAPDVWIERFFNIYALTFNDIEDDDEIFPPSDVYLMRHPQNEINRSRQGLREHRERSTPGWVATKGRLSDEDKATLTSNVLNGICEIDALEVGMKVGDVLQAKPHATIDPAMYDTNPSFEDIQRSVGSQEANFGGVAGATATESSISEGGRMSSLGDNVDDLDELLSELARGASQIMLMELSEQTVKEIVGVGAVWPELNREQAAAELYLDIKAGSSGRPNQAAELANIERAVPFLLQMPGFNPRPLLESYMDLLGLDVDEAIIEGVMSIVAQNQLAGNPQPATGNPATDPASQGGAGANRAPNPQQNEPNGQPMYPAPAETMNP